MKPRDENKIDQIYEATLTLVSNIGLSGITMSDIAKTAGLATGTVYIYFSNKEELINKLYVRCRQSAASIYFKDLKETASFDESLNLVYHNIVKQRIKKFEEAIFMEQAYHSPFVSEENRLLGRTIVKPLFDLIDRGKKENALKNLPTILLIIYMVGNINEMVKYYHYNNQRLTKTIIDNMFTMCVGGMKSGE